MYCVSVPKYEYDDKDDVLSLSVDDDDEYQCENYDDGLVFFSLYFVVVMICCSKLENKTTKDIV